MLSKIKLKPFDKGFIGRAKSSDRAPYRQIRRKSENRSSPVLQYRAHVLSPNFNVLSTLQSVARLHVCQRASFSSAAAESVNQFAVKFPTTDCCNDHNTGNSTGPLSCECPTTVQFPVNSSTVTIKGSIRWERVAQTNNKHNPIITTNNAHDAIAINLDMAIRGPAGNAGVLKSLG